MEYSNMKAENKIKLFESLLSKENRYIVAVNYNKEICYTNIEDDQEEVLQVFSLVIKDGFLNWNNANKTYQSFKTKIWEIERVKCPIDKEVFTVYYLSDEGRKRRSCKFLRYRSLILI
jgi:hypothetical protein